MRNTRKDVTERSGFNGHKTAWAQSGGKRDRELKLDLQHHGKMFQRFADLGNPQNMYWHISF